MTARGAPDGLESRVLKRPLTLAGRERAPGETVRLRPDQVERLTAEGYFAKGAGRGRGRRPQSPEG